MRNASCGRCHISAAFFCRAASTISIPGRIHFLLLLLLFPGSSHGHRYSYSDTQLAELITHAAVAAQWGGRSAGAGGPVGVGVGISGATPEGKRRRLMGAENASASSSFTAPRGEARTLAVSSGRGAAGARSPLETIEERSRHDPDWAAWHYRQAWFLQVKGAPCRRFVSTVRFVLGVTDSALHWRLLQGARAGVRVIIVLPRNTTCRGPSPKYI